MQDFGEEMGRMTRQKKGGGVGCKNGKCVGGGNVRKKKEEKKTRKTRRTRTMRRKKEQEQE